MGILMILHGYLCETVIGVGEVRFGIKWTIAWILLYWNYDKCGWITFWHQVDHPI